MPPRKTERALWKLRGRDSAPLCHLPVMKVAYPLARKAILLNDAVAVDAAAGLMAESVEQKKLIGSPNQVEAVMSNLQKRAANYKD